PLLSSDMNGSRPPPSYANTSRTRAMLPESGLAESPGAAGGAAGCCAASGAASAMSASATLVARTGRRRLWVRRLHERANRELPDEQRARGITHEAHDLLIGLAQQYFMRHHDPLEARDVGQELADLVVMPEHFQSIAIRIERRPRLGAE